MNGEFFVRLVVPISILCTFAAVTHSSEFYVLQGVDKALSDDVLTSTGVDGFTIRVSWRKLHEEGFEWLDDQVARGDELNLNMQLRVMAGDNAPDNLLGVSYFDYLSEDTSGVTQIRRAPVPWDAELHVHFQNMAANLASRYGDTPRIKVVHVSGFANSAEMHMPDETLSLPGYSSRVLAESWASVAQSLSGSFPDAIIALNFATPMQSKLASADSEWLLERHAILAAGRAGYQANDLAADIDLSRNKYQTIFDQYHSGRHIGFQMVSSSDSPRFGGEFLSAVAAAQQMRGEWLEIYASDVSSVPLAGDYNFDGKVDAADYTVWRKGLSNHSNLDIWISDFGEIANVDSGSSQTSIPEPSAVLLVIVGAVVLSLQPYVRAVRY